MGTNTLIDDIYKLLETKKIPEDVNIDYLIHEFGEAMKKIMKRQPLSTSQTTVPLRLSNVGRLLCTFGISCEALRRKR